LNHLDELLVPGAAVLLFVSAGVSAGWGLWAGQRPDRGRSTHIERTAGGIRSAANIIAAAMLGWAILRLSWLFWTDQFTYDLVAQYSHRGAGIYKLASLWASNPGSLLALTFGCTAVITWRLRSVTGITNAGGSSLVTVVVALLAAAIWAGGDLFEHLPLPPLEGGGMPPILEHPAMLIHPPLMLAFMVCCFGFFVAWNTPASTADVGPDEPREVAEISRRHIAGIWALGTLTMMIGSFWAYGEVGWGGFWAWDAVENTSLMPWLALLIALHVSRAESNSLRAAAAASSFALVMLGTAITRTAPVGSVHAFAIAGPDAVIIQWTTVLVAGAVVAKTVRAGGMRSAFTPEGGVISAMLTLVLVGTLGPALIAATSDDSVALRPRFFVLGMYPLAMIAVALQLREALRTPAPSLARQTDLASDPRLEGAATASLHARTTNTGGVPVQQEASRPAEGSEPLDRTVALQSRPTKLLGWAAGGTIVGLTYALLSHATLLGAVLAAAGGCAAGAFIGVRPSGVRPSGARRWGAPSVLGHVGFGILLIGIGTSTGDQHVQVVVSPGDTVSTAVGSVTVHDLSGSPQDSLDAMGRDPVGRPEVLVSAAVSLDGQTLRPAIRHFPLTGTVLAEPDGSVRWDRDLWISLVRVTPSGAVVLGIETQPGMPAIWIGCVALIAAGLTKLRPRRTPGAPAPPSRDVPVQDAHTSLTQHAS